MLSCAVSAVRVAVEIRSEAADCSTVHARSLQSPSQASPCVCALVRLTEWQQVSAAPRALTPSCRPPSVAAQCDPVTSANQSVPVNRPRLLLFRSNLLHAAMK